MRVKKYFVSKYQERKEKREKKKKALEAFASQSLFFILSSEI